MNGENETAIQTTRDNGHWLNQWAEDLDEIYAGTPMAEATAVDWGLLYEVNPLAWDPSDEPVHVTGPDWTISFVPPGGPDPRQGHETIDRHACIVLARLGVASLNEARDRGRPLVRQIASIAALESRYIANQVPIWEGPMSPGSEGTIRFGSITRRLEVPLRRAASVAEEFAPYREVALEQLPERVRLSMHWYSHAWGRLDLVDRFSALWWAALSLVDGSGYSGNQRARITAYAESLAPRFAVGQAVCDNIRATLSSAYDRRNELFHESRWSAVDEDIVTALESTVSDLLKWETLGA